MTCSSIIKSAILPEPLSQLRSRVRDPPLPRLEPWDGTITSPPVCLLSYQSGPRDRWSLGCSGLPGTEDDLGSHALECSFLAVTWLMPQLELDESRHRAKKEGGFHPGESEPGIHRAGQVTLIQSGPRALAALFSCDPESVVTVVSLVSSTHSYWASFFRSLLSQQAIFICICMYCSIYTGVCV